MSLADDAACGFVGVEVDDMNPGIGYLKPNMLGYLAAPYSHKDKAITRKRMEIFHRCDAALMKRGFKTMSPLAKDAILKYENLPGDWNYWGEYSEMMLARADVVIVLTIDGWEESEGVQAEMDLALERGITIIWIDPAELMDMKAMGVNDDGAILVKVSKIENTALRRLVIAGSFVPMTLINILLVAMAIPRGLLRNMLTVVKTARKHW